MSVNLSAPMDVEGLFSWLGVLLGAGDVDGRAFIIGFSRLLPAILLVPAFGLRSLPAAARFALGLSLAAAILPAIVRASPPEQPLALQIALELLRGLPAAITAATALWVASMAGSAIDEVRGAPIVLASPEADAGATGMGALFAIFAAVVFLQSGGPARIASALVSVETNAIGPLSLAAANLAAGIQIAIAIAAPVLVAKLVIEFAFALTSRVAMPLILEALLQPLKVLIVLGLAAVLLEHVLFAVLEISARLP